LVLLRLVAKVDVNTTDWNQSMTASDLKTTDWDQL